MKEFLGRRLVGLPYENLQWTSAGQVQGDVLTR